MNPGPNAIRVVAMRPAHRATAATWYGPTPNMEEFLNDRRNVAEGAWEVAVMYPTWLCRRLSGAWDRPRFREHMNKP